MSRNQWFAKRSSREAVAAASLELSRPLLLPLLVTAANKLCCLERAARQHWHLPARTISLPSSPLTCEFPLNCLKLGSSTRSHSWEKLKKFNFYSLTRLPSYFSPLLFSPPTIFNKTPNKSSFFNSNLPLPGQKFTFWHWKRGGRSQHYDWQQTTNS